MLSTLPGGLLGGRYGAPPARVVALHGWRRNHTDWDEVVSDMAALAPDLPGFGSAPAPDTAWGAADYAEAVMPLCSEGGPVVLIGHSFGGKVAVVLAATHPQHVAALILTGVPLLRPAGEPAPRPALGHRVAKQLHRAGLLSDTRMEARRRRTGSDDYRAATGIMRDVLVRSIAEVDDGRYRRALEAVRCPVEFVWGQHDTAAVPAVAEEAAALVPTSTLTVLPGVSHMTPNEAPDALRVAIRRHL